MSHMGEYKEAKRNSGAHGHQESQEHTLGDYEFPNVHANAMAMPILANHLCPYIIPTLLDIHLYFLYWIPSLPFPGKADQMTYL